MKKAANRGRLSLAAWSRQQVRELIEGVGTARLRPLGFGAAAFSRFASEGWWGRKDSNLRSHKTADLQSAPFATRDTPPLNSIGTHPPKWRQPGHG